MCKASCSYPLISIYTLSDLGDLSHLIGSLSRTISKIQLVVYYQYCVLIG